MNTIKTKRTPTFLMANLGSEMSQLFSFIERDERKMALSSAHRAEKIIEELLAHPALIGRTGEIEILQRIIQDTLSDNRRFTVKKSEIESYFFPFVTRLHDAV